MPEESEEVRPAASPQNTSISSALPIAGEWQKPDSARLPTKKNGPRSCATRTSCTEQHVERRKRREQRVEKSLRSGLLSALHSLFLSYRVNPCTKSVYAVRGPFRLFALHLAEVLVEPVGHHLGVLVHALPAVRRALLDHQLRRDAGFLQLGDHDFRLLDRHQLVGVAVDDQGRRVVGADVADRRNLPAKLAHLLLVGDRDIGAELGVELAEIERRLEAGQDGVEGEL